jgi:drug/metabolite transporter (DMT)-like permease
MSGGEWAMLLFLSVLWGGSFFFIAVAVDALPTLTIVLLRVGLAALVLDIALYAVGQRLPLGARYWKAFFAMAVLNNAIPFTLVVWGTSHIASGLASILNASAPLWALVVVHFVTHDEKITRPRIIGVLIGFAGIIYMIGADALRELGTEVLAQLAVLGAALCYALASALGRRLQHLEMKPLVFSSGQFTAATLIMLPMALFVDRPWLLPVPGVEVMGAVTGLAVLSTAAAYIIYFRVLSSAGAVNILLVTFLVPVTAILLGALILHERLAPSHFTGMALIGIGLAIIDGRLWRRVRARYLVQ